MSTLDHDLARLNFEYLLLARECARSNPVEAAWRFGMDRGQIEILATLTIEKIRELADNCRAAVKLLPFKSPENVSVGLYSAMLPTAAESV